MKRHRGPSSVSLIFCMASVLVLGLGGCQTNDLRTGEGTVYLGGYSARDGDRSNFDNYSHWDGDGVTGPPRITIRLREQRAYFYKGEELVEVI